MTLVNEILVLHLYNIMLTPAEYAARRVCALCFGIRDSLLRRQYSVHTKGSTLKIYVFRKTRNYALLSFWLRSHTHHLLLRIPQKHFYRWFLAVPAFFNIQNKPEHLLTPSCYQLIILRSWFVAPNKNINSMANNISDNTVPPNLSMRKNISFCPFLNKINKIVIIFFVGDISFFFFSLWT